jgi:hypothetical protein
MIKSGGVWLLYNVNNGLATNELEVQETLDWTHKKSKI